MFQSRAFTRLLTVLGAAVASVALFAPLASAATPNPGFTQFAGCPSPAEKALAYCFRADITGGHIKMGSKDVPIKNPIKLVGGVNEAFEGFTANAEGGLSHVKQEVPGGVIGITGLDWLVNFLNLEGLKLYAVTEAAGLPTNLVYEPTLPIKVHLENPVLGKNCYIGSFTNPIVLKLTTGTTSPPLPNKPITGKDPVYSEAGEVVSFKNGVWVDNSFAVPSANGCVLTLFGFIPVSINGLVNTMAGLPSAAGNNEAVQNMNLQLAVQETVY